MGELGSEVGLGRVGIGRVGVRAGTRVEAGVRVWEIWGWDSFFWLFGPIRFIGTWTSTQGYMPA